MNKILNHLQMYINLAVKDSIGGWKDNAFNYKSPTACTSLKNLLGSTWISFLKSLGIDNLNCPLIKVILIF